MPSLKSSARRLIPLLSRTVSTRLVQMVLGNFVPVFMLHRLDHPDLGIEGDDPVDIRRCLEMFRARGYQAISLQQLGEYLRDGRQIPYKCAVFTIDDGFIDHHDIAAPLFAEYDIPLTFFLITDFIDGRLWPWDDQVAHIMRNAAAGCYRFELHGSQHELKLDDVRTRGDAVRQLRQILKSNDNSRLYEIVESLYRSFDVERPAGAPVHHAAMSWDQAAKLSESGHCIAAHTRTHRILSQLADDDAAGEITASIAAVRTHVPGASDTFAYPTGRSSDFSAREAPVLEQEGILATVSTVAEPFIPDEEMSVTDRHSIPRFSMPSSTIDFIQYLGWIEFVKHNIRA